MSAWLCRRLLRGFAAALGLAFSSAVAGMVCAGEARDPAEVLRAHGLTRVNQVWIAPVEVELRRDLAELPKRRERILALERELDASVEANARAWQASQPAIAALKQSLSRLGSDDPRREAIERQIEALKTSAVEPARLGARSDVRSRVIDFSSERTSLAAAIVRIRTAAAQLKDVYDRLAQGVEMIDALSRLGEGQRLGPQRSYRTELTRLAEYERLAFAPWTPVYWHGHHLRFSALVDDRLPITFCWNDATSEPTTITHTAAEAAGIAIPADAPRETIMLGDKRRTTARRVVLPRLRIGRLVLDNVAVLVLTPEAEDWGCRLGREALSGRDVRLEPERLRLWIDAG